MQASAQNDAVLTKLKNGRHTNMQNYVILSPSVLPNALGLVLVDPRKLPSASCEVPKTMPFWPKKGRHTNMQNYVVLSSSVLACQKLRCFPSACLLHRLCRVSYQSSSMLQPSPPLASDLVNSSQPTSFSPEDSSQISTTTYQIGNLFILSK